MAVAHDEDVWQKSDLFAEQKVYKQLETELMRDYSDGDMFQIDFQSDAVPDISDQVFELNTSEIFTPDSSSQFDCDELLSSLNSSSRSLEMELDNLDSTDPLRHDCMWSGLCPNDEHRSTSRKSPSLLSASDSSSISPGTNSVFDTPLQSDFETSDIEENFREEMVVEKMSALEKSHEDSNPSTPIEDASSTTKVSAATVQANIENMYSDHCYISPLPRPEPVQRVEKRDKPRDAGEKHSGEARTVTSIILKPCNQIRKGKDETSVTGMTRPPGVDMRRYTNNNRAQPKFKFQMKFVAASDGGMPGPLLSHPSRPNRTHYHKRKAAIKNTFCQSTVKQIQRGDTSRESRSNRGAAKNRDVRDVRDLHNSMERQRRVDLKKAFDGLKFCVPELADSDKASKLMILDKAADFCQKLKKKEIHLSTEKERERKKHFHLKRKLQILKQKSPKSLKLKYLTKGRFE